MALAFLVPSSSPPCCSCRNGILGEQRRIPFGLRSAASCIGARSSVIRGDLKESLLDVGSRAAHREVLSQGRLKVTSSPAVENGQIRASVEIPVTCYQILGVPERAEKDEIVKSVIELKGTEIEDGYTMDVISSRQDLLMDVRDKLLFEPEYAGNTREKILPKSFLRIPWAWLPGALCLLQEVGEVNLVLEIGRAALQHMDAKPYIHDLLLSMALAECSFAKTAFEKSKVSQGFEALARAQYLLQSKISLGKMPLLSQIEESLEELAPACTLELLSMPLTPDNAERRRGALSALRELLRQGFEVETSCRVRDWPGFLSQALSKLTATEILDLLSWDSLAATRKNKKSLESQNQRVVIDFNCFYVAMIAHIAVGFTSRQTDLIHKAKTICECLIVSESTDLKLEEAFCSLLLGQAAETDAFDKLQQLEFKGSAVWQSFEPTFSSKKAKDGESVKRSLELWLKDTVLRVFPDTRDCSPSLGNFFGGQKRLIGDNRQSKERTKTVPSATNKSTCVHPLAHVSLEETPHKLSTRHIGEAVKQLAPANLQSHLTVDRTSDCNSPSSFQLKRDLGMHQNFFGENWWCKGNLAGRIAYFTFVGCFVYSAFKLLYMQFGQTRIAPGLISSHSMIDTDAAAWNMDRSQDQKNNRDFLDRNSIVKRLGRLLVRFRKELKHPADERKRQYRWPIDDVSLSAIASIGSSRLQKRQMPTVEAESLVKQWQAIKAEALGPNHQIHALPEVLVDSMLSEWQALADSAKASSCYWRFVLLQLSILRADILFDGVGGERAEIDAILEEAAELVDESQPKNPNYYSTYKIRYILKRQCDGSWRFCGGCIQTPT